MRGEKQPLWRKVNTRTHGVHHAPAAGDARHERNIKDPEWEFVTRGSMHRKHRHGRDFTPLFRFLLSRVGKPWAETEKEAVSRLDDPDPIFWMVARREADGRAMIRAGESSYFSGLFVDEGGFLRRVDPDLKAIDLVPFCACCTHTLNGERFGQTFAG